MNTGFNPVQIDQWFEWRCSCYNHIGFLQTVLQWATHNAQILLEYHVQLSAQHVRPQDVMIPYADLLEIKIFLERQGVNFRLCTSAQNSKDSVRRWEELFCCNYRRGRGAPFCNLSPSNNLSLK